MKIAVEASILLRRNKTGVAYYGHSLIGALARAKTDDDFYLCFMQFAGRPSVDLGIKGPNVFSRRIWFFPSKIYNALDHYLIPPPIDLLAMIRADVFFFPNFFRWPLLLTRNSVVVIHDLGFVETPEYIVPRHRKYLCRRVPQSARRASHIIAISESTKRQLVTHYDIAPEKISVVTPAVDVNKYKPATDQEVDAVKAKYGITKPYLLYLGTIEPRKNIRSILEGYLELPEEIQSQYQLVLAGGKGWLDEEIYELAYRLPEGSLVRTGYVVDGDEPALYTGATLFLYPSHYEGWGMQLLEAMACGTPVITARNSSLPESGGDAAAYVKTGDAKELSELIESLLKDQKRREEMVRLGTIHIKKFTWEASAKVLAEVLKRFDPKASKKN